MNRVEVWVPGLPRPKGNMRWNPHARRVYEATPGLDGWTDAIVLTVTARSVPTFAAGQPVQIDTAYLMPRPLAHWGANGLRPKYAHTFWHTTKPDLDKLDRAVFDALTRAGVVADDTQFCCGFRSKRLVQPGEQPGVRITLAPLLDAGEDG